MAIENGESDLVRLLINNPKIDVNVPYKFSSIEKDNEYKYENQITCEKTALHIAVEKGDFQSATYLCDQNIDVNAKTKCFSSANNKSYEKTALHIAVEKGHFKIICSLLEHEKIDVTVKMH